MRQFITDRIKKWNPDATDDQLVYACSAVECLVTEKGFGLAGDCTEGTWIELKLNASLTTELIEDLKTMESQHLVIAVREIYCLLANEISNEMTRRGINSVAYVRLESVEDEFTQRHTIFAGVC